MRHAGHHSSIPEKCSDTPEYPIGLPITSRFAVNWTKRKLDEAGNTFRP